MKKNILLIVDPQYDFCEGGSLAVNGGNFALNLLGGYLNRFKNIPNVCEYKHVIITCDWHPNNHCSFVEQGGQWPAHCVQNTHGAEIHEAVMKGVETFCKNNNISYTILRKGNDVNQEEYSVFQNTTSGTELLDLLEKYAADEIEISGIAGDYCCLEHIKGLIEHGYKDKITVLNTYIASIDGGEKLHQFVIDNKLKSIGYVNSKNTLNKWLKTVIRKLTKHLKR